MLHPVGAQCIDLWQTDLQGVKSKDVRRQHVHALLLPRTHVVADGRIKPVSQRYNLLF